eukprot:CAMPEP_0198281996 /NCGR_PEP_ID=MMETSP1449-20131203/1870_1 /TAXON_ID=420275 /ORGANISM="Attheya septentrionalis, Strain CCMP2084" /LENGTH=492 /DNA_ID=CAMNT_0043978053 /DNA_START=106 /DNA_END=1581 /DNA_ORIENTATION=+
MGHVVSFSFVLVFLLGGGVEAFLHPASTFTVQNAASIAKPPVSAISVDHPSCRSPWGVPPRVAPLRGSLKSGSNNASKRDRSKGNQRRSLLTRNASSSPEGKAPPSRLRKAMSRSAERLRGGASYLLTKVIVDPAISLKKSLDGEKDAADGDVEDEETFLTSSMENFAASIDLAEAVAVQATEAAASSILKLAAATMDATKPSVATESKDAEAQSTDPNIDSAELPYYCSETKNMVVPLDVASSSMASTATLAEPVAPAAPTSVEKVTKPVAPAEPIAVETVTEPVAPAEPIAVETVSNPVAAAAAIATKETATPTALTTAPVGDRWAIASPETDLSGKWKVIVSEEFKKEYDEFLQGLGQPMIVRTVALSIIGLTSEETEQGDEGRTFFIHGTNARGVWERTLVSSGADCESSTYHALHIPIVTADSEHIEAEAWWEKGGTVHRSWMRGGKKYGGGDFESLRYLEQDGDVYVCESIFHPSEEGRDQLSLTW